jgi:hypothetical protein
MFDFYKNYQANAKLAQDVASNVVAAGTEFAKSVFEVNTRVAQSVQAQMSEAYKSMEAYKFPGLDAFVPAIKTSKKSAE